MLGVILAAGKGTRMKADKPKVLFEVAGRSMIRRVIDVVKGAGADSVALICGYKSQDVKAHLEDMGTLSFFEQKEQLGTGHAVMQVDLDGFSNDDVIIMPGDTPLFQSGMIREFIEDFRKTGCHGSILTTILEDPHGYGRIIRKDGSVLRITEHKDAKPHELDVKEINTGVYAVKRETLKKYLKRLDDNNAQKEYYLTDIFKHMIADGLKVGAYAYPVSRECMGVNSRRQLMEASLYEKDRVVRELTENGVTINDPGGLCINGELTCGEDVEIISPVTIKGDVRVESGSRIGPFVYLEDCRLEKGEYSFLRIINENTETIVS